MSQPGFTREPSSPSNVLEGNGLFLQWNYTLGGAFREAEFMLIRSIAISVTERSASDAQAFIFPDYQGRVEANITATQTNITLPLLTRADAGSYALQVAREPDRRTFTSSVTITVQCKVFFLFVCLLCCFSMSDTIYKVKEQFFSVLCLKQFYNSMVAC